MVDADYLAALRAQAAEVRADLEEREANYPVPGNSDPEAEHDNIMAATRIPMPSIIHKTNMDARVLLDPDDGNGNGDNEPLPLTDEQIDIFAQVLAQIRKDFQAAIDDATAPLRDRIVALEAQISLLTNLLNDSSKTIEASETVRKLHVR
jgi:hypothetical protein